MVGRAGELSAAVAGFASTARSGLDVAIYDFRLTDTLARPVVAAFTAAAARGGAGADRLRPAGQAGRADHRGVRRCRRGPGPAIRPAWTARHLPARPDADFRAVHRKATGGSTWRASGWAVRCW